VLVRRRPEAKFGFDDALDVVGVHLVGGLVGSVLIGFFADPAALGYAPGKGVGADGLLQAEQGLFFGGGAGLLVEQVLANAVAMVFSFVVTYAIAKVLDATIGLRVSEETEVEGLDIKEHAETAYSSMDRSTI
jgi:Amt family ammonium transporter